MARQIILPVLAGQKMPNLPGTVHHAFDRRARSLIEGTSTVFVGAPTTKIVRFDPIVQTRKHVPEPRTAFASTITPREAGLVPPVIEAKQGLPPGIGGERTGQRGMKIVDVRILTVPEPVPVSIRRPAPIIQDRKREFPLPQAFGIITGPGEAGLKFAITESIFLPTDRKTFATANVIQTPRVPTQVPAPTVDQVSKPLALPTGIGPPPSPVFAGVIVAPKEAGLVVAITSNAATIARRLIFLRNAKVQASVSSVTVPPEAGLRAPIVIKHVEPPKPAPAPFAAAGIVVPPEAGLRAPIVVRRDQAARETPAAFAAGVIVPREAGLIAPVIVAADKLRRFEPKAFLARVFRPAVAVPPQPIIRLQRDEKRERRAANLMRRIITKVFEDKPTQRIVIVRGEEKRERREANLMRRIVTKIFEDKPTQRIVVVRGEDAKRVKLTEERKPGIIASPLRLILEELVKLVYRRGLRVGPTDNIDDDPVTLTKFNFRRRHRIGPTKRTDDQ